MKKLLFTLSFLLCLAAPAKAADSLTLNGSSQYTVRTITNASPYTSVGAWRVETWVHNLTTGGTQTIRDDNHAYIKLNTSTGILTVYDWNTSDQLNVSGFTGHTNFVLRVQRDTANSRMTVEAWDIGSASRFALGTVALTSTANRNYGNTNVYIGGRSIEQSGSAGQYLNGRMAFLRWYSTVTSYSATGNGTRPALDANAADLGQWEFESNLNDSSGNSQTLTFQPSGSPTYNTTPEPPPTADAGVDQLGKKGGITITLNGTGSLFAVSYAWTQLTGTSVTLSGASTDTATFTSPNDGNYHWLTFRVTATAADLSTDTDDIGIGIVPQDANGLLTGVPANAYNIIGRQLVSGHANNPYPWFDTNQRSHALTVGRNVRDIWTSEAAMETWLTANVGDLAWPYTYTFYYDFVMNLYIAYYRTGDPELLELARYVADLLYDDLPKPTDPGWSGGWQAPREAGILGLILRALDEDRVAGTPGTSAKWDFIRQYTDAQWSNWVYIRKDYPGLYFGIRDGSYATMYATELAEVLPNSYPATLSSGTVTDGAARRASLKAEVEEAVADYYLNLQYVDGSWRWGDFDAGWLNNEWYTSPTGPGFGMLSFHVGLLLEALDRVHKNSADATLEQNIEDAVVASADNLWTDFYQDTQEVTDYPPTLWRHFLYSTYHGYHPTYSWQNLASLDGAHNSSVTTITVIGTAGYADSGTLAIDTELVTYTGRTSTSFTGVTRGAHSTTAASHSSGATVSQVSPTGTTLTAGINSSVTTIPVALGTVLEFDSDAGYGEARIDDEIIQYTGRAASQLTGVTRGARGTTAASHSNGAGVYALNKVFADLSAAIDNTTTTINVRSTEGCATTGAFKLGSAFYGGGEEITYTGKTSTSFTGVGRGGRGSTAASWPIRSQVRCEAQPPVLTPRAKASGPTSNGDSNLIGDARQLNATVVHAYGVAYRLTGESRFKTRGDEIFEATYGGADGYRGRADYNTNGFRAKEYNEAYRRGGSYLVDRLEAGAASSGSVQLKGGVRLGGGVRFEE